MKSSQGWSRHKQDKGNGTGYGRVASKAEQRVLKQAILSLKQAAIGLKDKRVMVTSEEYEVIAKLMACNKNFHKLDIEATVRAIKTIYEREGYQVEIT